MAQHSPDGLLLPIETAARELDGKLLLALFAAEAGFRCHIGAMGQIQSPGFPPSIYVSKSVRFAKIARLMRGFGHTIVAWDEEGLARFSDEIHNSRIEAEAFSLPSLLFSWGQSNSDLWRRHPSYDGTPIADVGNPRMDLLRPELHGLYAETVDALRQRYGRFALFNSNFGFVNHFKPSGRKVKVAAGSHDAEAYLAFRRGVDAHKRRLFEAFRAAIAPIARRLAPHRLVVRPHPSEDHAAWRQAAEGLENVTVVYEGPVVPWLLAARCLIHNGCTSAIEAAVLRLPALAYRPVTDDAYDIHLPNELSENFAELDGLCRRARDLIERPAGKDTETDYSPLLHPHITSLEGPLACQRIVEALLQMRGKGQLHQPRLAERFAARSHFAYRRLKRLWDHEGRQYEDHKAAHGELSAERIAARAAVMSALLGRFKDLRILPGLAGTVMITRP